ncbi:hypothetical protein KBY30_06130 [Ruegeria pomeroyi]|nr:hypothetical protein [Ruegeria pomeroyi]
MRVAVFAICLAYALFFGWNWVETVKAGGDAAGRGMKWALGLSLVPALLLLLFTITYVV